MSQVACNNDGAPVARAVSDFWKDNLIVFPVIVRSSRRLARPSFASIDHMGRGHIHGPLPGGGALAMGGDAFGGFVPTGQQVLQLSLF